MAPAAPRVSVLLPVRDAQATLPACLDSLRRQTLDDYEIVAVDDGSRDETPAILAASAAADSRLHVHTSPPRGLVAALCRAVSEARAPFLARMDADDVAAPQRLARQWERLEGEPSLSILGARVRVTDGTANDGMLRYVEWQNALVEHDDITRDIWIESPLVHPSVMMRAATLSALGGYREAGGPEDYDLWLRAHAAGARFGKVPEILLEWRDTPRRLTRTDPRYAWERFLDAKANALVGGFLAPRRAIVVWGAGPIGKAWALALLRRHRQVAAFVEVDPRKIGQRIHGIPVVAVAQAPGRGPLHLGAVGRPEARQRIRQVVHAAGLVEGPDFLAVA